MNVSKNLTKILLVTLLVTLVGAAAARLSSGAGPVDVLMAGLAMLSALPEPVLDPLTDPPGTFHTVKPGQFDPGHTYLVQGAWLNGIGCPTDAFIAVPNSSFTGVAGTAPFTDAACPTGDPKDQHNEGLLLVKTGRKGKKPARKGCNRASFAESLSAGSYSSSRCRKSTKVWSAVPNIFINFL